MRAGRLGPVRPVYRVNNAVILFWVGPYRMGIEASALKEIRNDSQLAPEESRCEAILSTHALLQIPAGPGGQLLVLRPGQVGVRVDRVERMMETSDLRPLPRAFQGSERSWYRGLFLIGEAVCPVLNPNTLASEARLLVGNVPAPISDPEEASQEAAPA